MVVVVDVQLLRGRSVDLVVKTRLPWPKWWSWHVLLILLLQRLMQYKLLPQTLDLSIGVLKHLSQLDNPHLEVGVVL